MLFLLSAYLPNISLVGQYFSSIVSATFSLQNDIYISETEDSGQCKLQPDNLYKYQLLHSEVYFRIIVSYVEWWSSMLESRKQTCVALSAVEAEYVALANSAQEVIWMG